MSEHSSGSGLAEAILHATASLIEDHGVEAVTMRAVAARAGYSPTAIYLCFKNKEDLLEQTLIHAHSALVLALFPQDPPDDVALRLRSVAVTLVRWGTANPNLYRLLFEHGDSSLGSDDIADAMQEVWVRKRDLLAQAIDRGLITRCTDPDAVGQIAWAALHGIVWLAASERLIPPEHRRSERDVEERAAMLADTFVSLVLDAPGAPPA